MKKKNTRLSENSCAKEITHFFIYKERTYIKNIYKEVNIKHLIKHNYCVISSKARPENKLFLDISKNPWSFYKI